MMLVNLLSCLKAAIPIVVVILIPKIVRHELASIMIIAVVRDLNAAVCFSSNFYFCHEYLQ
jgi:hypothetical protein